MKSSILQLLIYGFNLIKSGCVLNLKADMDQLAFKQIRCRAHLSFTLDCSGGWWWFPSSGKWIIPDAWLCHTGQRDQLPKLIHIIRKCCLHYHAH